MEQNVKKLSDFAKKEKISTKSGGHIKLKVFDTQKLEEYLAQHDYRIGPLASELGVNYSTIRRLLKTSGLHAKCKIDNHRVKGGRKRTTVEDKFGYIYAGPEHDYLDDNGDTQRRPLHMVIAEEKIGRKLASDEVVHHINLDKKDNRPENLAVCNNADHRKMHQDLEHLAGRLMEAGYISFVPELSQYVFVGPNPKLEYTLGDGFVKCVNVMGNDSTVVNAARVSFGKRIDQIREQDKNLLEYLAKNGHTSPFRHCYVQLHVKAPEFVARQWYKHVVGSEYSFKDQPWNEISGRYVTYELQSWQPEHLRKQSADKKQGSSEEYVDNEEELLLKYKEATQQMFKTYEEMLAAGVCKEQARTLLPLNFYTEWYWTASLQTLAHFVKLRTDPHAQVEIQEYANLVNDIMLALFPNAWRALKV